MKRVIFLILLTMVLVISGLAQTTTSTAATATTADAKPKKPTFRSNKDQVKQAQTMLKDKKLFTGEVTGVSSADWKTAVKSYQGDNGLTKTGMLNRATLEKMGIELTDKQKLIPANPDHTASVLNESKPAKTTVKSTASTSTKTEANTTAGPKRPAPFQANKDQITALQSKLRDVKFFSGEADGERSDGLKEAVKKYQESNSLKVTGGINAPTLEKMGIALTDKQKDQVAAQAAYDASRAPKE